jgi:NAD(P)-dependent dehydrogenase (short-subunit alcohol dehydrogenase family)
MADLKGKVALVTGASSGIGREVALRLARRGADVFAVAEGTEAALREVTAACGGRSTFRIMDLAFAGVAEKMVEDCLATFGRVDILVNNAGARCYKPFGEFTQQDYEFVQGVNLRTPFFASQAVLPAMRAQGGGRIVIVASCFGEVAAPNAAIYGLTKAALIHLTKSIAFECSASGIVVNSISPGPTLTPYIQKLMADRPELPEKFVANVPMGRFIKTEEVAEAIEFLCTSEGTAIQGANLLIDGGFVIH